MNGKEKMIDLVKGYNLPLQEKHTELFKKDGDVFKKHHHLFGKHQGLFAYASGYTYGGISLHVYTHQATRIYVSSYTYVRMSLHVYMSLCQAPSYPVPGFD